MTVPNGRANGSAIDNPTELVAETIVPHAVMRASTGPQFSTDQIKELIGELEVPFDLAVIEWRVTNTIQSGKLRGQAIPYADHRAYTDRLNRLFTPAGWTRKYSVHTSVNFQRRCRPEDGREGLRHLRADNLRPRITLSHGRRMDGQRQCRHQRRSPSI